MNRNATNKDITINSGDIRSFIKENTKEPTGEKGMDHRTGIWLTLFFLSVGNQSNLSYYAGPLAKLLYKYQSNYQIFDSLIFLGLNRKDGYRIVTEVLGETIGTSLKREDVQELAKNKELQLRKIIQSEEYSVAPRDVGPILTDYEKLGYIIPKDSSYRNKYFRPHVIPFTFSILEHNLINPKNALNVFTKNDIERIGLKNFWKISDKTLDKLLDQIIHSNGIKREVTGTLDQFLFKIKDWERFFEWCDNFE